MTILVTIEARDPQEFRERVRALASGIGLTPLFDAPPAEISPVPVTLQPVAPAEEKPGRGRPKGSPNKPKDPPPTDAAPSTLPSAPSTAMSYAPPIAPPETATATATAPTGDKSIGIEDVTAALQGWMKKQPGDAKQQMKAVSEFLSKYTDEAGKPVKKIADLKPENYSAIIEFTQR